MKANVIRAHLIGGHYNWKIICAELANLGAITLNNGKQKQSNTKQEKKYIGNNITAKQRKIQVKLLPI